MSRIKARVIGAGGYGGVGIVDLLLRHPEAEVVDLVAKDSAGVAISEKFPHLKGFCDLPLLAPEEVVWDDRVNLVFTATPDRVGSQYADSCMEIGAKLIDFSGDFRFNTPEAYAEYAGRIGKDTQHPTPHLLSRSAYGLAELHREDIARADIVGNPGCFATAVILGYAPLVRENLIHRDTLICDAKTGISGAGIKAKPTFHYPSRYENMNAYKIAGHQHNMEVERELSLLAGEALRVTFTPQVMPLARGILCTHYGRLQDTAMTAEDLTAVYEEFYKASPFVRIVPPTGTASNNDTRGSNFCVIWVNTDPRTGQVVVVSHIDNLMKGQAGSALQNMNLLFGLDEKTGLDFPAFYP